MAFNGDGPHSKRQRLEESGHRNHEYSGYGDEPRRKREDNNKPNHVLLFTIINPVYPITVEVLHAISAPSGQVQRIVIFKKNGVQAMVEFDSVDSATRAKETLHGADIYSGCCTLKIDFAKVSIERDKQPFMDALDQLYSTQQRNFQRQFRIYFSSLTDKPWYILNILVLI
ncbi:PREDICTED: uncharacterized protein LOC106790214 [Polistes canadensis]|uniref:uncharacterized protein LOC106790214 n=1 Tax=Polistes canadensis TaxID=91411 RepID=UPI000718D459|nr:PREDICTED: uncharacterized protein LOC106790214 [Polistes canadensis]